MRFTVPEGWDGLTQKQLQLLLRVMWVYRDEAEKVKAVMLLRFCDIEVDSITDCGFLCRERKSGREFLLDRRLLPAMTARLDWIDSPEDMSVRLGRIGGHEAVDFELRGLMFGEYLVCDNYYQSFLQTNDEESLRRMGRILYRLADDDDAAELKEEKLLGVMMWWMAAKRNLGRWFPDFLKPAGGGTATRESMAEGMRVQIRLLTGGDVTKEEYILEHVGLWTALGELNAKAKEAEEIMKKYGK